MRVIGNSNFGGIEVLRQLEDLDVFGREDAEEALSKVYGFAVKDFFHRDRLMCFFTI